VYVGADRPGDHRGVAVRAGPGEGHPNVLPTGGRAGGEHVAAGPGGRDAGVARLSARTTVARLNGAEVGCVPRRESPARG
jgi:hypothetical protein